MWEIRNDGNAPPRASDTSHPRKKLASCELFLAPAMKTILSIAFLFLLVFFVMVLVAINCQPRIPGLQAVSVAFEWTLHLLGGIVATASAIGMLAVAATHGSFQRQIVLALPLLAGLLLISVNWGVALAFGAVAAVWIFKYGAPEIERTTATPKV